ncbi:neuropeptide F receptor-like [Limulus polyphemus]|uniref:Neuropeptide F receptor-like n=1 Tax=Limulus polyphemus TaxID=6850 RepID=A0ABM1BM02_LIMPO|nr:neuropeptide F receptor-like [Limulus polyphemus]
MDDDIEAYNFSSVKNMFNFSYNQAMEILKEHTVRSRVFSRTVEATFVSCYTLLIATGVCVNLLILFIIVTKKSVYTHRNLFVVNLNISDLALCLLCMPFTLVELILRNWPLGEFLCKVTPFVQASTIFVSASTISAIAIDRHYSILTINPAKTQNGKRRVVVCTCVIWLVSMVLSLPICIAKRLEKVGLPGYVIYEKCIEEWPSSSSKLVYLLITLIAQLAIPATVLLTTHFRVKAHLNFTVMKQSGRRSTLKSERTQRELRRKQRATMVLLNVSLVFTISWLPWNVINLVADLYPTIMSPKNLYMVFAICHLIAMSSATSNPIMYGWLNTNIKRELVRFCEMLSSALLSSNSKRENSGESVNAVPLSQLPQRDRNN